MLYFDTLPKILTPDQNGNGVVMTNLMTRAKIIEDLEDNPLLFYTYTLTDGETPEMIADKYYGDSYKYWIILYANKILDPVWQWHVSYDELQESMNYKYATEGAAEGKTGLEYALTTVHHYEKISVYTNETTKQEWEETNSLSFEDYSAFTPASISKTLPDGSTVSIQESKRIIYVFDYESAVNESRRIIKILNENYVNSMESQFQSLMSSTNV